MSRLDRYVVNTSANEPGITTNSLPFAEQTADEWGTEVIDAEAAS